MTDYTAQIGANIRRYFGAEGVAWLGRLPELIAWCEQAWELQVQPAFSALSINYVTPALDRDGNAVVLKLGVPGRDFRSEIAAMELYAGRGIARLLRHDAAQGTMLLERLTPGTPLAAEPDDARATQIAAEIMRKLWRPAPADHSFPTVADLARDLDEIRQTFGGTTGPFPERLVDQAQTLFRELLASSGAPVVLHGDLHHMNILAAEREPWLAIDPKGIIGEPEYEVGALIRNPMPHFLEVPAPDRKLARRLDQLAEQLGFDRERLRLWSLAQVVLGAWWGYDEHGDDWRTWIWCAELLDGLKA